MVDYLKNGVEMSIRRSLFILAFWFIIGDTPLLSQQQLLALPEGGRTILATAISSNGLLAAVSYVDSEEIFILDLTRWNGGL